MAKKKISYSKAINEIEQIIEKIENEELDVDELSRNVERVSVLLKSCRDKLHETEQEVEKILNNIED